MTAKRLKPSLFVYLVAAIVGTVLALFAPRAGGQVIVIPPAEPICEAGKLIGLAIMMPHRGPLLINIPLDVCDEAPQAVPPVQPASRPRARPAREA